MHTVTCTPYHGHIQQASLHKFSSNWRATAICVGIVEGSCHLHFGTNQCVQLKDCFTTITFTPALSGPEEAQEENIYV